MNKPLKLEATEFESTPTASQIADLLERIYKFGNIMVGYVMAEGGATVNDPKIANTLNGFSQLDAAAKMWRGDSPIAQGAMMPQQHRRQ